VSWLRQCADWLAHLDAESYPPTASLRPAADWPDRAIVAAGLARVAAVIDRIAADVDELARARRAQDLDTAAVLPDPRAERRRRLAEVDRTSRLLHGVTGHPVRCLRSPYGLSDRAVDAQLRRRGLAELGWDARRPATQPRPHHRCRSPPRCLRPRHPRQRNPHRRPAAHRSEPEDSAILMAEWRNGGPLKALGCSALQLRPIGAAEPTLKPTVVTL
jgi:hypothetical protein